MAQFNNNYEDFIQKVITAETSALNSKKGQEILQKLYDEAKAQNPDITAEEWSEIKKQFMVSIFHEILKENPNFMSQFIGLVKEEIAKNKIYTIMGTSVDEGMSRQQNNFIRNRYKELLKDLSMIEIQNDEDKITGLALAKLYETGKVKFGWPNFEFDQNNFFQSNFLSK